MSLSDGEIIELYKNKNFNELHNYLYGNNYVDYPTLALEWDNNDFREYVFDAMLNGTLKNPYDVVIWAENMGTHLEELFNIIMSWVNRDSFLNSFLNDVVIAHWILSVKYKNIEIKIKAIMEGVAEDLIGIILHIASSLDLKYTVDDFFEDLPVEYQLNIVL